MTAQPYAEVIGDPIDHSLSPVIHRFWLERLGIDADYRRQKVTRAGLADYLDARRGDLQWLGCNVTMPLKLDALSLADEAGDRALGANAANILIQRKGRLFAGNSDVGGMATLFDRLRSSGAPMGAITILGNGGGARGALMALHMLGLANVRIQSRDLVSGLKLAVEFGLELAPHGLDYPIETAGLINATPLGMTGMPPLVVDWEGMSSGGWVFDLVTAPVETELLKVARERGMTVVTGIEMLVEQAAESFEIFFDAKAPRDADAELMARLHQ